MTEKGKQTFVQFYVIDPSGCGPATGIASNITVWISQDFETCSQATNSVSESSVIPGMYEILLTATEMDADYITVCPTCTSYFIHPVTVRTSQIIKNRTTKAPIYIYNATTGEGIAQTTATIYVVNDHQIGTVAGTTTVVATNPLQEVDSTHAPGLYYIDITATEMECDRLTIYAKPTLGYARPVTITSVDFGALPVPDIDITDHAYDCLRYELDQLKALENKIYAHLANWRLVTQTDESTGDTTEYIYTYDQSGTVLEAARIRRDDANNSVSIVEVHPSRNIDLMEQNDEEVEE